MSGPVYVIMVEHEDPNPKSGPAIISAGDGCHSLEFCQSLAQRMEETGHGKSTIGIFTPISKLEQKEIQNGRIETTFGARRTSASCKLV